MLVTSFEHSCQTPMSEVNEHTSCQKAVTDIDVTVFMSTFIWVRPFFFRVQVHLISTIKIILILIDRSILPWTIHFNPETWSFPGVRVSDPRNLTVDLDDPSDYPTDHWELTTGHQLVRSRFQRVPGGHSWAVLTLLNPLEGTNLNNIREN